jgi:hypothetical protein
MLIAITGIAVLGITGWLTGRPLAERYVPNWILRRIVGPTVQWPLFQLQRGASQDWAIKILQNRLAVESESELATEPISDRSLGRRDLSCSGRSCHRVRT